MIGIAATALIWASLSIGGASAENCYKNLELRLQSDASNTGWNNIGRGFLGIFTPAAMTDEQWQILGKIVKNKEMALIKDFAMTMGGLIFLAVVSVLFILVFCAAPIALGVFTCTCKKKCKPKSNAIIMWSGIGCNSLAILTISLSLLFCFLSIKSVTNGITGAGNNVEKLPKLIAGQMGILKEEIKKCGTSDFISFLQTSIKEIPGKISSKIMEIPKLKDVMDINIKEKQDTIVELENDSGVLEKKLSDVKKAMEDKEQQLLMPGVLAGPLQALKDAKDQFDLVKAQLTASSPIRQKLETLNGEIAKGSQSEIEKKIKDQTVPLQSEIDKLANGVDKQIEDAFGKTSIVNEKLEPVINDIKKITGYVEQYAGYMTALNLVLFPCYLALASAILSTCQATKFVQKKKAKPKDKCKLLIPIAIGLGLAFLPLLISTAFMMVAGISTVACKTVFEDKSYAFLPNVLKIAGVEPVQHFQGLEIDIQSTLAECTSGKSLISILKGGDTLLKDDMITTKFDIAAKKNELANNVNLMDFGLPNANSWTQIKNALRDITNKRIAAKPKFDSLRNILNTKIAGLPLKTHAPDLEAALDELDKFLAKAITLEKGCTDDIAKGEQLDVSELKAELLKVAIGDTTSPTGLLDEIFTSVNGQYLAMRKDLLEHSTNCQFIFDLFESVGNIVCKQATGGLNGAYAAIGLGALSFISASIGTVMIWHSLRVGKGQEQKTPGSSDSKKGKKKAAKKGEGEEGGEGETGGEEEEVEAVEANKEPFDWKGKIGEQATPIGPGGPTGQPMVGAPQPVPPPLVQAVPTDPTGSDTKTNPSLLPNDAPPTPAPAAAPDAAGAQPESGPAPPNPIQMVNMEANNNQEKSDKQNSLTGAGGGETAGPGTSQ